MSTIGIMAAGPEGNLPNLTLFDNKINTWIGVDRGALILINNHLKVSHAVGDFDSVNQQEMDLIKEKSLSVTSYPKEKDQTDIEIAILKAKQFNPKKIYLFGVTGGRMDHELINLQLLYLMINEGIRGLVVDKYNEIEMKNPSHYIVEYDEMFPNISFIPFSEHVINLSLEGFYYPLNKTSISWGSTLCISNKLLSNIGTFSFDEGILLLIKSRDVNYTPIPM